VAEKSKPLSKAVRLTFGMPVYNGQAFLHQAIDSVLAQSFESWELIISDNASTDQTQAICEEYARNYENICYTRQETNIGAFANFANLLSLARGEYFKWIAYDDYIAPAFAARMVALLDSEPDTVLCTSDVRVVKEPESRLLFVEDYPMLRNGEDWNKALEQLLIAFSPYVSHRHGTNYSKSVYGVYRKELARREFLEQGFLERVIGNEFPFLIRVALQGRIVALGEQLWTYREHSAATRASGFYSSSLNRFFRHNLLLEIQKTLTIFRSPLGVGPKFRIILQVFARQPILFLKELKIAVRSGLRGLSIAILGEERARRAQTRFLQRKERGKEGGSSI
jgi:glycosyltransferase involved in cell wall biosynthesis